MLDESLTTLTYLQRTNTKPAADTQDYVKYVIAEKLTAAQWTSIGRLLNRDWWGRFAAGKYSLSFEEGVEGPFIEVFKWTFWTYFNNLCPSTSDFELKALDRVMNLIPGQTGNPADLIETTKLCSCLDDRDRVYGLLSLLPSEYQNSIHPDYTLGIMDVYKEIVRENQCHGPSEPSWIPELGLGDYLRSINYVSASGRSQHEVIYIKNSNSLGIAGLHATIIKNVGHPMSRDASVSEVIVRCRRWEPADLPGATYGHSEPMLDAFVTILCGGYTKELFPERLARTVDELRSAYLSFRQETTISNREGFSRPVFWFRHFTAGRAFFTTTDGYMGLCPVFAEPGDSIVVALG